MKKLIRVWAVAIGMTGLACESNDPAVPQDTLPSVKASVNVKIKVGDFIYENVDAPITVKGLSASDDIEWSHEFAYQGGDDAVIEIAGGYDHYEISMTKWGITDRQIYTYQQLFHDRADGDNPTTYVFGGEMASRKLTSVTRSYENTGVMVPAMKDTYEWADHRLTKIRGFEYNAESQSFTEMRHFDAAYSNNKITSLTGYLTGNTNPYIVTSYTYLPNGNLSQIKEVNSGAGISNTVDLTYSSGKVMATFTAHNGNSFEYEFVYQLKNIVSDKTTKGGTTCNIGSYDFDKNINPFRHLGYMDLLLTYFSINNKISDDVVYSACSFPEIVIESYEHEYNDHGYPVKTTLHYSNEHNSVVEYTYQ
jgi:hypothetical protein